MSNSKRAVILARAGDAQINHALNSFKNNHFFQTREESRETGLCIYNIGTKDKKECQVLIFDSAVQKPAFKDLFNTIIDDMRGGRFVSPRSLQTFDECRHRYNQILILEISVPISPDIFDLFVLPFSSATWGRVWVPGTGLYFSNGHLEEVEVASQRGKSFSEILIEMPPVLPEDSPAESTARRSQTEQWLMDRSIPQRVSLLPFLPVAEEIVLRETEEVISRMVILAATVMPAHLNKPGWFRKTITQNRLEGWLSEREKKVFMEDKWPDRVRMDFTWNLFAAHTLAYALGIKPKLAIPPEPGSLLADLKLVFGTKNIARLKARCKPLSASQILDLTDRYYLMHWACRESYYSDTPMPVPLEMSIVHEQRKALEWLISPPETDWDEVEMST